MSEKVLKNTVASIFKKYYPNESPNVNVNCTEQQASSEKEDERFNFDLGIDVSELLQNDGEQQADGKKACGRGGFQKNRSRNSANRP